jgi:hypothetical protein
MPVMGDGQPLQVMGQGVAFAGWVTARPGRERSRARTQGLGCRGDDGTMLALRRPGGNASMQQSVDLRRRGIVKFSFWTVFAGIVIALTVRSYMSGQMAEWFYHRAAVSGYAVNVDLFKDASVSQPASLQLVGASTLDGLVAVRVAKGDRLPRNTNGVIADETVAEGERVVLAGSTLQILVPWQIKEAKGFKFKDTFKHKGVETWPWAGVWNVLIVALLGLSLGLMAEGFTDMLGLRIQKIQHHTKS